MRGDLLGVLECPAVLEVGGDAGGAERVVADRGFDSGSCGPSADHPPGVSLGHRRTGKRPSSFDGDGTEKGAFLIFPEVGGGEVSVEILLEGVVGGDVVALPTFFVESQPRALPLRVVVLDLHAERGADAGERVEEGSDQGAITELGDSVDVDRVEEFLSLAAGEDGGSCRDGRRASVRGRRLQDSRGTTCPSTSQSRSMRTAARCCFTVGFERALPSWST